MHKFLPALFLIFFYFSASGQSPNLTVKGSVADSVTNQALGYVTVALQNSKTQAPVKSTLAKDDGAFELTSHSGKDYQLVLAFVGYKNKIIPIKDTAGEINVGKILLSPSNKELDAVNITSFKPLMTREVDRISYNVQSDPESKALSALDMMRKVPLLSVDANDNIKLKGSGSYKILINGRESALMAKNPSDVLKAMPATNIERIEVITTPPAKYDAEGLAGIINIITKKGADQGYNMGINGRYNTNWGPALNINGTFKQGKFGLSGYAGVGQNGNIDKQWHSGSTQTFFNPQSVLSQNGTGAFGGRFNYASTELSYEIDTLNLLTGSIEYFGSNFRQLNDQISTQTDNTGAIAQQYNLTNNGNGNYLGLSFGVNYQLGFKKQKDRLLTISYKYDYSPNKQFNNNMFSERLNYPMSSSPDYQQYNNAGNKVNTLQLDYAHPLKTITVEAGAKAILRNNFSNYHLDDRDSLTNKYITNPSQTNDFNYQQNVYSLYNSYQVKLSKWTGKAGLRLEHTTIDADFASTGSAVNQNYNNLIPSVSIQRNFKNSSVNFGFTERIQRPGIYQLNPFVDESNPKYINTGNPNLRPELNKTFELNYSNFTKTPVNIGLSYAFSNNSIQNVSGLQVNHTSTQADTVTVTTYQNLGSNNTLGLNFNTTLNFTKQLSLNVNAQLSHVWLTGEYNGQFYKNDGYMGNATANASYKLGKGYRVGADFYYFSGGVVLQGQTSSGVYSSLLISREFLNKKATISLVANNPYSKYYNYYSSTGTNDYYQSTSTQTFYRSFAVRFNYKFGKLKSEIKKNQHGINNDDTKNGGKSSGGGN